MRVAVVWLLLIGCGRVSFDTRATDATVTDAVPDAFDDGIAGLVLRYAMDDDPQLGLLHANAPMFDASCAPCPVSEAGIRDGGYRFSGQRVELPGTSLLVGAAPYTVAVWLNADLGANFIQSPVNKVVPTTSNNVLSVLITASGNIQYETVDGTTNTPVFFPGPTGSIRGAWHHIALSWDGTTHRIHRDGIDVGNNTVVARDSSAPLAIGGDYDVASVNHLYAGAMDELRVYDRALATAEIAVLATP